MVDIEDINGALKQMLLSSEVAQAINGEIVIVNEDNRKDESKTEDVTINTTMLAYFDYPQEAVSIVNLWIPDKYNSKRGWQKNETRFKLLSKNLLLALQSEQGLDNAEYELEYAVVGNETRIHQHYLSCRLRWSIYEEFTTNTNQ